MTEETLVKKWLAAFGQDVDAEIIEKHVVSEGNFLWHLFTWGEVVCLEGDEARKAFDALEYTEAIQFYGGYSSCIDDVLSVKKVSAEALDADPGSDVYVVAKDFSWTYVRTHETEMCGPYFCVDAK